MRHLYAALLFVLGLVVGLFGGYPSGSNSGIALMVGGGLLSASALCTLLVMSAIRGSRRDEPPGYIHP